MAETEPHPMEAWAPGISSGHLDASPRALAIQAEEIARIAAQPRVQHLSEIEAERRQREAAAEAARRAGPDPRQTLHQAHQLAGESQAEVDRLQPLVERARRLVQDLEQRQRRHEAETEAKHTAAATALIEALGSDRVPVAAPLDAVTAREDEAVMRTGLAALARLEHEHKAALDLAERRRAGVARCAVQVLVAEAVDLADAIVADAEALHQRRADLSNLATLLTSESRRLHGPVSPPLPQAISRALYPADRQLVGADRGMPATDWASRYRVLCEAPPESEG